MHPFVAAGLAMMLSVAAPAADDATGDPLPDAARDALARYESAKMKAEAEAAKVVFRERLKLKSDLEKCLAAETRKGNFEGAMAVKELIEGGVDDATAEQVDVLGQPLVAMIPANRPAAKSDNTVVDGAEYPHLVLIDGKGGWYAFDIEPRTAGDHYLYALYASMESRPCALSIGDQALGQICEQTTSTWNIDGLRWVRHGPYKLRKGVQRMKITPAGFAPHVSGFALSTDAKLQLPVDAFTKAAAAR
ncbi:MAG TPA: hypothetical protein VEL07_02795 [Planctomycetota bacterium]|nr:hypothetical protein [Planctomycetota bacterium]